MDKFTKRKIGFIAIIIGLGLFIWLPIVPIQVVPEVTLKVIDLNGNPMSNIEIIQYWSYTSENHTNQETSDKNGQITFSERKTNVSLFTIILNKLFSGTIVELLFQSSPRFQNGFRAKDYKSENKWCYPCNKGVERINEIVILEKNQ